MTQPKALRLADAIDYPDVSFGVEAAAELRRLYALNQELLEALKNADWYIGQLEPFVYEQDDTGRHEIVVKVRAVIAKVEEKT